MLFQTFVDDAVVVGTTIKLQEIALKSLPKDMQNDPKVQQAYKDEVKDLDSARDFVFKHGGQKALDSFQALYRQYLQELEREKQRSQLPSSNAPSTAAADNYFTDVVRIADPDQKAAQDSGETDEKKED